MKVTKIQLARHLRQEQTPAEKALWDLLRNRKFENLKFRRQHPLKDYIVDFYCDELELIIELDGGYHNKPKQKEEDIQRDFHLTFLGYKVLRYKNDTVFNDFQSISGDIKDIKNQAPSQRETVGVRERSVLSTKKLSPSQNGLLTGLAANFVEYDAIETSNIDFEMPRNIVNAIFTSQNAVKSFFRKENQTKKHDFKCFCVGTKTKQLLEENGQKVAKMFENSSELANFIVKNHKNEVFYFFCGNLRRDEIPSLLKKAKIDIIEVKTYETRLILTKFDQKWDEILFFSPSGVKSFTSENKIENSTAICIGDTTASEAKKYTQKVVIAENATVESVIEKLLDTVKGNILSKN